MAGPSNLVRSSIAVDLPDVPIGRTSTAAVTATNPFHDINEAIVHSTTSPKRLGIDPAGMSAKTAGHLNIMP